MFSIVLKISFRNALRNPRRSILTVLAIIIGICSAITLSSIARGVSKGMLDSAIMNLSGHAQIHHPRYRDDPAVEHSMPPPTAALLESLADQRVKAWGKRVRVPAVVMSERASLAVSLVGIEPEQEAKLSFLGDAIVKGQFFETPGEQGVIVGEKLLELLQTELGKRVVLMSTDANKKIADRGFRIVGVFKGEREAIERSFVFVTLLSAQEMLGMQESISEISLLAKDQNQLEALLAKIQNAAGAELEVAAWQQLEPMIAAIMRVQSGFLYLWFLIIVTVVSFGIINTLFMAIFERLREISLMQALGMKPRLVFLEICCGSLILIACGCILGNVFSFICVELLQSGIDLSAFAEGAEYVGFKNVIYPIKVAKDWLVANLLIFVVGALSSLYPAWKASRHLESEHR